jgi:DNA invertase Pin-like site-specific DNA recombinase
MIPVSRSKGSRRTRPPWRSGRRPPPVPALGYASVPTGAALDGPEVEAQRLEIESACRDLGLQLVDLVRDHEPGDPEVEGRPGLSYALERIDAGEASCLIVSALERLSRRVPELATVVDRLERARVRLIAIDVGLDTATPSGRLAIERRPVRGEAAAEPSPAEGEPAPAKSVVSEPAPAPAGRATSESGPVPPLPSGVRARGEAVRALGYASTAAHGDGKDLAAQERAIRKRAERLGVELVEVVREREPKAGKALDRAGLSYLIERLAAGDAGCVVVTGLERLSRSVAELGTIVQWLERNDVRLVGVDLDLDTASPGGRTTARALASVGTWERERLSERTRKGLAAARAKRRAAAGGSASDWEAIRKRIAAMRADGMTLQAIADVLNAEGVPTQRGGAKWRPSSVQTAAGYKRRARSKGVADLPDVDPPTGRGTRNDPKRGSGST